jgi:hypothetical protein
VGCCVLVRRRWLVRGGRVVSPNRTNSTHRRPRGFAEQLREIGVPPLSLCPQPADRTYLTGHELRLSRCSTVDSSCCKAKCRLICIYRLTSLCDTHTTHPSSRSRDSRKSLPPRTYITLSTQGNDHQWLNVLTGARR